MEKIILSHVGKQFSKNRILKDVNMELISGNIYGLIGPNGSGKTMILKMIAGLIWVTEGEILLDGKKIGKDLDFPPSLGLLIENPGFLSSYTGYENLWYIAKIRNCITKEDILKAMKEVGIFYAANQKVGKYSLGMKQRLGTAQAIMENPEVILLDEPMNGLDQQGIKEIRKLLLQLKEQKKLILLASHAKEDIQTLCDRIFQVENGCVNEIESKSVFSYM